MKCTIVYAAILISGAAADNCAKVADHYKVGAHTMKTVLTDMYCGDASGLTSVSKCGECCESAKDTCYAHAASLKSECDAATHYFSEKSGKGISQATYNLAATTATFKATCCQKKATCSGYTGCAASGMKDKATMGTVVCDGLKVSSCDQSTCCDADTTKCGSHSTTQSCGANKMADSTKLASVVKTDGSDYATLCCKDMPAAVTPAKCSTFTCPAGFEKNTNYDTTNCAGAACNAKTDQGTCCTPKKATCGYVNQVKSQSCDKDSFVDGSKRTAAAKDDGTDFKANCCTKRTTCTAFGAASINVGSASLANKERASAVTVLLMLAGATFA